LRFRGRDGKRALGGVVRFAIWIGRALVVLFSCLFSCIAGGELALAEALNVPADYQGRQIQLSLDFEKPPGPGPFAVVILLPGCSAELDSGLNVWANQLHGWGYATLRVESTAARGLGNICGNLDTMKSMIAEEARDVFRAAAVLAGRPDVKPNKIAVLGRSLGSNSLVWYLSRNIQLVNQGQVWGAAHGVKLQAAVAITPNCENQGRVPVEMPLLILAGALDDWNVASRCSDFASAPENEGNVTIKVYPGAYHGYDRPGPPLTYFGHHVEYNPAATQDSYTQVRSFLGHYLQ
jgi:dienelactone hydrolase